MENIVIYNRFNVTETFCSCYARFCYLLNPSLHLELGNKSVIITSSPKTPHSYDFKRQGLFPPFPSLKGRVLLLTDVSLQYVRSNNLKNTALKQCQKSHVKVNSEYNYFLFYITRLYSYSKKSHKECNRMMYTMK